MTKNKEMKKISIIFVFALIAGLLMIGSPAKAAYDSVTFTSDTYVYISDLGINLTITSGSKVESFVVKADSIDFNMLSGSVVTVRSTDHKNLSGSGASMQCGAVYSEIGKDALSTVTWTVTPSAGTCTQVQASGGGTSSGGSTTTSSTTTATTTVPTTTATTTTTTPATTTSTTTASTATIQALPYATPTTTAEMQANLTVLLSNLAVLQAAVSTAQSTSSTSTGAVTAASIPASGSYSKPIPTGSTGSDVTALQTFLKSQGTDVYPEGLVTGYFGSLTKKAVQKFQVKYGIATSSDAGYGTVGPKTRAKINSLLGL